MTAVAAAAADGWPQSAVALALALGEYLTWRSLFEERLRVTDVALRTATDLGDWISQGRVLLARGNALWSLRLFQGALEMDEQVLEIFRRLGDRPLEGMALDSVLRALWDFETAISTPATWRSAAS